MSLGFHGNAFVYASFWGWKVPWNSALNEVLWPRHIPWETGIHQPRFQVLWANNGAFCNLWAVRIFTSDTSFRTKMPKFSSQRRKKRKFHGNRFTSKQRVQDEEIVALESTSSGSGASSFKSLWQIPKKRSLNQRKPVVSPTSRFAYKSIRLHWRRFAYMIWVVSLKLR